MLEPRKKEIINTLENFFMFRDWLGEVRSHPLEQKNDILPFVSQVEKALERNNSLILNNGEYIHWLLFGTSMGLAVFMLIDGGFFIAENSMGQNWGIGNYRRVVSTITSTLVGICIPLLGVSEHWKYQQRTLPGLLQVEVLLLNLMEEAERGRADSHKKDILLALLQKAHFSDKRLKQLSRQSLQDIQRNRNEIFSEIRAKVFKAARVAKTLQAVCGISFAISAYFIIGEFGNSKDFSMGDFLIRFFSLWAFSFSTAKARMMSWKIFCASGLQANRYLRQVETILGAVEVKPPANEGKEGKASKKPATIRGFIAGKQLLQKEQEKAEKAAANTCSARFVRSATWLCLFVKDSFLTLPQSGWRMVAPLLLELSKEKAKIVVHPDKRDSLADSQSSSTPSKKSSRRRQKRKAEVKDDVEDQKNESMLNKAVEVEKKVEIIDPIESKLLPSTTQVSSMTQVKPVIDEVPLPAPSAPPPATTFQVKIPELLGGRVLEINAGSGEADRIRASGFTLAEEHKILGEAHRILCHTSSQRIAENQRLIRQRISLEERIEQLGARAASAEAEVTALRGLEM